MQERRGTSLSYLKPFPVNLGPLFVVITYTHARPRDSVYELCVSCTHTWTGACTNAQPSAREYCFRCVHPRPSSCWCVYARAFVHCEPDNRFPPPVACRNQTQINAALHDKRRMVDSWKRMFFFQIWFCRTQQSTYFGYISGSTLGSSINPRWDLEKRYLQIIRAGNSGNDVYVF